MIKVLMIGWEFPPYAVGGLGTHCWGLTHDLHKYADISFVVPIKFKIFRPIHMKVIELNILSPKIDKKNRRCKDMYTKNFKNNIKTYAKRMEDVAVAADYDIIHCQDWMTMEAGISAKKSSGKPLIITCHSIAFDTATKPGKNRQKAEKKGFNAADKIIAVSNYTKDRIVRYYGIPKKKIEVVYNAVIQRKNKLPKKIRKKRVLYAGRLEYQKGIDYLLEAASRVLVKDNSIKFVVVGHGGREDHLKRMVKELGISKNVKFLGYVKDLNKMYRNCDLFVMPSVSEPFGITPLEAMKNGTPCIVTKQSGVSEILKSCKKFDYWDIKGMANSIYKIMTNNKIYNDMRKKSLKEVKGFTWDSAAKKTLQVYKDVLK